MMPKWIFLILLFCLVAPVAAGVNLSVSRGETFLKWTWDTGYYVNVTVDGTVVAANTSTNYTYLYDLEAMEEHRIEVVNASNGLMLESMEASTLMPFAWVICLMAGAMVFFCLTWFGRDILESGLFGSIAIVISVVLSYVGFPYAWWVSVIGIVFGVGTFTVLALALVDVFGGKNEWTS